jgi:hypothetical protein
MPHVSLLNDTLVGYAQERVFEGFARLISAAFRE